MKSRGSLNFRKSGTLELSKIEDLKKVTLRAESISLESELKPETSF